MTGSSGAQTLRGACGQRRHTRLPPLLPWGTNRGTAACRRTGFAPAIPILLAPLLCIYFFRASFLSCSTGSVGDCMDADCRGGCPIHSRFDDPIALACPASRSCDEENLGPWA